MAAEAWTGSTLAHVVKFGGFLLIMVLILTLTDPCMQEGEFLLCLKIFNQGSENVKKKKNKKNKNNSISITICAVFIALEIV